MKEEEINEKKNGAKLVGLLPKLCHDTMEIVS